MVDSTNEIMIEADNVTKRYAGFTAVKNLTFTCKEGEIVGFLGPNGAGKTTTMRMLTGYMPPTSGDTYISGYHTINDSMAARQSLGYLPETVPLYNEMSVEGYLHFIGKTRQIPDVWERVDAVMEDVNLLDRAESFISSLSKGMRQRVGLAQALIHDPNVLILDEPTIGLDPAQIVEIRNIIADVGRKRTVLLSTHILAEVEQICSRVIMIIDGQIKADMQMDEIRQSNNQVNLTLFNPRENTSSILAGLDGVQAVTAVQPNQFDISVDDQKETRLRIAETAVKNGWGLLEMQSRQVSLESIFLEKMRQTEIGIISDSQTDHGEEE